MRKTIVIIVTTCLFIVAGVALAKDEPQGGPFQSLWDAIQNLQEQIDNIELMPGPQGEKGDPGLQGEKGDKGDPGEQGPQGEPGLNNYPEPDWDSGWIALPKVSSYMEFTHNLGGDVEDYFIDATYRKKSNKLFTTQWTADNRLWYEDATPEKIAIRINGNVTDHFDYAKLRIWKIKHDDRKLVDTVYVDSDRSSGVSSNVSLESGKNYTIEVRGTWVEHRPAFTTAPMADAEYVSVETSTYDYWTDYQDGDGSNGDDSDLMINDLFIDWGEYNLQHVYLVSYEGQDQTINFKVNDTDYSDNLGSFRVKIYEQ